MEITFNNLTIKIKTGALIPFLLMLPNLVWMITPKSNTGEITATFLWLEIMETFGRAAILVLPFFFQLDLNKKFSTVTLIGMGLALGIYYATWIRYFAGSGANELFSLTLLCIPLPMAVAPIFFLLLSSYLMNSWWMLAASAFFGITHIWVSALTL